MKMDALLGGPGDIFRWWLTREWADGGDSVCWIMLNPSTADASKNDPTLLSCITRSKFWGFNRLTVVNIFPYRSPSPAVLAAWLRGSPEAARYAIKENSHYIARAAHDANKVIAAWGNGAPEAGVSIKAILGDRDIPLYHIGLTKSGQPKHPLARGLHRVPVEQQPMLWGSS